MVAESQNGGRLTDKLSTSTIGNCSHHAKIHIGGNGNLKETCEENTAARTRDKDHEIAAFSNGRAVIELTVRLAAEF
jgi:hypothetical protein